jgi:hypothetical protein
MGLTRGAACLAIGSAEMTLRCGVVSTDEGNLGTPRAPHIDLQSLGRGVVRAARNTSPHEHHVEHQQAH